MAKVFVFCIGGTGLRVMKSVVMLAASGMKTNGYDIVPVILDPHVDLEENTILTTTIGDYIKVYKNATSAGSAQQLDAPAGFFNTKIVRLEDLDNQQNSTSANMSEKKSFGQYLNVGALPNDDVNNYLIQTLYSKDNLNNSLSVGFKGNPNVGTVVLNEMISGADWYDAFQRHCEKGDRVFIISSIFGGTGASGYPLLEKKIKEDEAHPQVQNALMGAVTVLPYYSLDDPTTSGSDIDSSNFYTKTKAALSYYEKSVKSDYLYYAGEQSLKANYKNNEKEQKDTAHLVELVAASALFDFLGRPAPDSPQAMTRAIRKNVDALDISSLGEGYKDIVKDVANMMLFDLLLDILRVDVDMLRANNITKNRSSARVTNAVSRSREGQRRAQYFVPGAKTANHTAEMKTIRAVCQTHSVFSTKHLREHLFELCVFGARGNPTGFDGIIGGLRFAVVKI